MLWGLLVLALVISFIVGLVFFFAELSAQKRDIARPASEQRGDTHDTLVSHWEAPA